MSTNIVADFSAFLSVSIDGESLFETREGRVVMARDNVAFAGKGETRRLPLETLAEFDFRTVPAEWEQFFDDLVGVRFETDDGEVTVTIGTETAVADRFVTVVLKLLLDGTGARVRQRLYALDGEDDSRAETATFTLAPKRERLEFDHDGLDGVDVSTITGIARCGDRRNGLIVHHLARQGHLSTEITPESDRGAQLLETYLEFRQDLADSAGPIRLLFVGEDRDSLVLIAKLLEHRNLQFEAAHAQTVADALDTLNGADAHTECVVSEYELPEETAESLRTGVQDRTGGIPLVFVADEPPRESSITGESGVVDIVEVGSRTEHYEAVVNPIERAVLDARLDRD
jgi:hypothetical protein